MKSFTRSDTLFSLCGLNCGLCTMHLGGYCPGCGGGEGNQPCRIARCSIQHGGFEYCSQCGEFPCDKYEGIDAFDSFITHANQRKDLKKQKEIGAEAYLAEQEEKIRILNLLLENYNDGRKKTFFCLAVNLLELSELAEALEQAQAAEATAMERPQSLKEKSSYITALFQKIADEKGIVLKLRKKRGKSESRASD